MKAIEKKESSGQEQVIGDGGKAWGLFQFHIPRWVECTGKKKDWGHVGRKEQERVMKIALNNYLSSCPRKGIEDKIIWAANFHNIGHGSFKKTKYSRNILRNYNVK